MNDSKIIFFGENKMSFEKIIPFVLQHEGGATVTHDPNDPGGTTKYGISQKAHPDIDIENLTEEQACDIYKKEYWDNIATGQNDNKDMTAFDSAVNCGVGRVKKWLPYCNTWQDVLVMRQQHYTNIIAKNSGLAKYATGWENRIGDLENFIQEV
jgi:hypothetical protein